MVGLVRFLLDCVVGLWFELIVYVLFWRLSCLIDMCSLGTVVTIVIWCFFFVMIGMSCVLLVFFVDFVSVCGVFCLIRV